MTKLTLISVRSSKNYFLSARTPHQLQLLYQLPTLTSLIWTKH